MSKVSISKAGNDFYAAFARAINDIGERLISPGDSVLIKPNLVEPAAPDSGQITNPRVIEAVARYCLDHGAKRVVIGEGPSYYQPQSQLRECFTLTGVSRVAERLGAEWVLFDEHRYRTFKGFSEHTPDKFRVTEFVFDCDKLIDLPVLKTHYLTTVTLAMKNLKGCLKREDKPLFHSRDLSRAVVELCKIIKTAVNVIDCTPGNVVRQLGTGCSKEERRTGGLLIASSDIVAADSVGCALMGINPDDVRTVALGAAAGLGESELTRIDIIGEELKRLKFKVKLPKEILQQSFPLLKIVGADRACSGCLIPLVSSLSNLAERDAKLEKPLGVCLGKSPQVPAAMDYLLVGDCAHVPGVSGRNWVAGCPPNKEELLGKLLRIMSMDTSKDI